MSLQEDLKQDVIQAIRTSLTPNTFYQKIRPDISMFLAVTSTLPLKGLKAWERLIRQEIESSLYHSGVIKKLWGAQSVGSLQWLDLCHADGFRRERALRTLSTGAPNRFLFALAVRKLNDWVPQVRNAARQALPAIAEASEPEIIVDALFITLSCWSAWGRAGEAEKAILAEMMSMPDVAASLKKKLISSSSGPAATVFTQAGRWAVLDNFLTEISASAVQPALRAKAYRCQFEGRIVWAEGLEWKWIDKAYGIRRQVPVLNERKVAVSRPFINVLREAITDRSPVVRRIAGEMLIKECENMGDEALQMATRLAADISESVAERGRFALGCLDKST